MINFESASIIEQGVYMKTNEFSTGRTIDYLCFIFSFTIMAFFLFASCASTPDVIGRWNAVGEPGKVKFHQDGSFEILDNMGALIKGNYFLSKNGNLKVVLKQNNILSESLRSMAEPVTTEGKISVHGDRLTYTSSDGKEILKYKRSTTNWYKNWK